MAYELIETIELTSSAASIEFTSIPQDGTDLVLVFSARMAFSGDFQAAKVFFNNDTTTDVYSFVALRGNGSSASSNSITGDYGRLSNINASTSTANTFTSAQMYISNYASSSSKSISFDKVTENNATTSEQEIQAKLYDSTSAISSIKLEGFSNFVEHSSASLYKITAA